MTADVIETELRAHLHLNEIEATQILLAICRVIAQSISSGLTTALRTNLPTEMKGSFPIGDSHRKHTRPT